MEGEVSLLQCYNRGCGQKYNPKENNDDSCRHHPGVPVFHDAYKGWSCCSKKCTDFTEFLNIKGCTLSLHSNTKPLEPEKPKLADVPDAETIEVKPIIPSAKKRPRFDTPMINLIPEIAPSLKQQTLIKSTSSSNETDSNEVAVGTTCKNAGCGVAYKGPESDLQTCTYHLGVPIFHEGMKYWSCCKKRTTDFAAFLNQVGCQEGKHVWKKEEKDNTVSCRWDFHQTASHVVISIYAKQYSTDTSIVKLNPIRISAHLVFPETNTTFLLDMELKGIVDVPNSQLSMYGTKIEIKLKKAEPGSWSRLDVPKSTPIVKQTNSSVDEITPSVQGVDLSDL